LASYVTWKRVYADLARGFGADATLTEDWASIERDMLGVIGLDNLLRIERETVETDGATVPGESRP
jgi:hypothetical protein